MKKILHTRLPSIFLLGFAVIFLFTGCNSAEAAAEGNKTTTQTVERGDLILGLGADGKVALPVSNLNFGVAGTVSKIYVSVGDTVKAGDLLAELDDASYQFAIGSAQNNQSKSQTSYDNAVSQYDYSILSDEKDLNKLRRTINEGFDDYTYQTAISEARTSLSRKQEDLTKAENKAKSPFDPYTYDNQVLDAEKKLNAKQKEFDEALSALSEDYDDYTYQNTISEARINLERKQSALNEAETGTFDSYQYDNAIATAETNLSRKRQDYYDAQNDYYAAVNANDEGAETAAYAKLQTALYAWEDAKKTRDNAENDLERAKSSADNSDASKVDSAQQAVEDAKRQLSKALDDFERAITQNEKSNNKAYETAKEALEEAQASLDKAKTDRARAKTQAEEDAAEQVKSARQAASDAQTNLDKAITNLSRARADHAKQMDETLVDLQLKQLSADMNKNANSSIANAEFALEESKLQLEESENNLEQVKLYAPIDGQILSISKGVGENVSEQQSNPVGAMIFGTSGSSGSFITLCDVTRIYLTASITEGDIVGVSLGQSIQVSIDAIGEEVFHGEVTNVDSIPTTDSNGITTYTVTCLLDTTSSAIKDGMNAYITFVKKELNNVLLAPNKAVFIEDGLQYVNVVRTDGSYEKRKVICGLSNGVQSEVAEGLQAGEVVLVGKVSGS